jgi:hypothetical protein
MMWRPIYAQTAEPDEVKLTAAMQFDWVATRFAFAGYPNRSKPLIRHGGA